MPYMDLKVTEALTSTQKEALKAGFGEAITKIPGKTEAVTMIGIQDHYPLYMRGEALSPGAYVEVKTFGETAREHKKAVAEAIAELLLKELGIPGKDVYITFYDQKEWGCNGTLV